jgi:hypothetical protein
MSFVYHPYARQGDVMRQRNHRYHGFPEPNHTHVGHYPAPYHTHVGHYPAPYHTHVGHCPAPYADRSNPSHYPACFSGPCTGHYQQTGAFPRHLNDPAIPAYRTRSAATTAAARATRPAPTAFAPAPLDTEKALQTLIRLGFIKLPGANAAAAVAAVDT